MTSDSDPKNRPAQSIFSERGRAKGNSRDGTSKHRVAVLRSPYRFSNRTVLQLLQDPKRKVSHKRDASSRERRGIVTISRSKSAIWEAIYLARRGFNWEVKSMTGLCMVGQCEKLHTGCSMQTSQQFLANRIGKFASRCRLGITLRMQLACATRSNRDICSILGGDLLLYEAGVDVLDALAMEVGDWLKMCVVLRPKVRGFEGRRGIDWTAIHARETT